MRFEVDDAYQNLAGRTPDQLDALVAPVFPRDVFPEWIGTMSGHLQDALQVPGDLVDITVLGVMAGALAGHVRVEALTGWNQPVCLWVAGIASPGVRKSEVIKIAGQPLRDIERALVEAAADDVGTHKVALKQAQAAEAAAMKVLEELSAEVAVTPSAAAKKKLDAAVAAAGAASAAVERVGGKAPVRPRMLMSDATTEAVASALADHGSITIMSDEPAVWANVAGRYGAQAAVPNIEAFLQGYSGSSITIDRKNFEGGSKSVIDPALTMIIMAQPVALKTLAGNGGLSGRGFIDRWILAEPETTMGKRDHVAGAAASALGPPIRKAFSDGFVTMTDAVRTQGTTTLYFDDAARDALLQWMIAKEPHLGPGGELEPLAGNVSKRQGDIVRIAALLHIAHATDPATGKVSKNWLKPISAKRVKEGIKVAEWSLDHSKRLMIEQDMDPGIRRMRKVVAWVRRNMSHHQPGISRRDLFDKMRSDDLKKVSDLEEVLTSLQEMGWVARMGPRPKSSGGGRPSESWWFHPDVWA